MLWTAGKKRVAIVKSRQDEGADKGFGGVFRKIVADRADSAEFEITCTTDSGDVLLK